MDPLRPLPGFDLSTPQGREHALDLLGEWFAESLAAADGDAERATEVITQSIKTFYDIRESADQPRGEYAGHFFIVDAVGLDDSDRPVPWDVLMKRALPEHLERYRALFDRVEQTLL